MEHFKIRGYSYWVLTPSEVSGVWENILPWPKESSF
jgi:hypothetical protein